MKAAERPAQPLASERILASADRQRRWLPLVLGLFFLAFCNGRWRPESDGAVALTVGRSIARGTGFAHPDGLDAPLSPGLPHVAAWGFRLLGPDSVLLPLVGIGACWAAGLWLCFALVRRAENRPTAVVVTALLGLSEAWLSYGLAVRTDLPFATGTLAVLLGVELLAPPPERETNRVGGVLLLLTGAALCVFTRSVWVVVAAAVALALFAHLLRARRWGALAGLLAGTAVAAAAAWSASAAVRDDAAVLLRRLGRDTADQLRETVTERIPRLFTESLPEVVLALDVGPVAGAAASFLLIAGLVLASTRPLRPLWLLLPGLFALQWSLYAVHDRYALPILPLLLLGGWTLAVRLEKLGPRVRVPVLGPALRWAAPAALCAVIGMNLAALVEVFREQRSPEPLSLYADGKLLPTAEAAEWLRVNTPTDAVVLAENDRATTLAFLADRRVLSGRELEKLPRQKVPATVFTFEPLDGRARRAADAAGYAEAEPVADAPESVRRRVRR